MVDMHLDLMVTERIYGQIRTTDADAFRMSECSRCGRNQALVVAKTRGGRVYWLRCSNCGRGIVEVDHMVSPGAKPLSVPRGLPEEVAGAWNEVRSCLSVGASTAAVLVARKILLHVAVSFGLPAKNDRGRAPDFAEAVGHLEAEGLITRKMKPWVDRIRTIGNEATHDLPSIAEDDARDVAVFTEQLLKLAYEMDDLMGARERELTEASETNSILPAYFVSPSRAEWVS